MIEAVSYRRVSGKRQGKSGLGLAAQKRIIANYCVFNQIILVKDFYEIQSGEKPNRQEVWKAIKYCLNDNKVLLVATQSRLARSVLFIANLIVSGPQFRSIENPTANDFQKHVQAAFDEQYLRESSRNTKQSLQSAVERGVKLGTNVVKLKRTLKRKRKAYLRIIRPIVREIQKRFHTVRAITDELNRQGIKKLRGDKGGWQISMVHGLIRELSTKHKS